MSQWLSFIYRIPRAIPKFGIGEELSMFQIYRIPFNVHEYVIAIKVIVCDLHGSMTVVGLNRVVILLYDY